MVSFEDVTKLYDNYTALKRITFSIQKGEMVYVTGPSGAGKSTLLKLIYQAERPDEGVITVAGVRTDTLKDGDVPYLRRRIGVVFQDFRLLASRTVYDNVALALRLRGMPKRQLRPLVMETLKMVHLRHKADAYPPSLSGGEQQRVVIARAIVAEPMLLLADEPTGNLDVDTAAGIMRRFKEINAKGTTVVIATHNRELFRNTGLRVLRLDEGLLVREEIG